jgi:hypothetical protein
MKDFSFKKILPHLIAIVIFIAVSMVYFAPLMEGKQLNQSDNLQYQGASKEISDYRVATGNEALWTNSMFGGMPAYQISVVFSSNMVKYIDRILHLGLPGQAGMVFLYFIGFYIMLLAFKVNQKLSTIGAIGFGFSSFFLIILAVGHNTQAIAIGYIAPVIAGVILCFRGKYILGGILSALFLALEFNANHLQITYYLMLIIFVLVVFEFIYKYKEKKLKEFFKAVIILFAAAFLAIGTNFTNLWSTYEYGKESTRGKSELTANLEDKTSGLDRSYAVAYSYGRMETFTLLIPDFMGGSSDGELGKGSDTYKALQQNNVPTSEANKFIKHLPMYWGPQGSTYGPVYVGAILCFLFVLGLFIVKGKYKWWLLVTTILAILLSWGKNLMWFSNLFFDYIPGYDKFRAVSMTLVIVEFCIPLLGLLALKNIFSNDISKEAKVKALKYSSIITLGIIILFGFLGSMFFDFISASDKQLPEWLIGPIQSDRHGLLMADSFRSFVFIALTAAGLWLYAINKFKNKNILIIGIGALILIDMWTIDKRMLNADNFVKKSKVAAEFTKSKCDDIILADNSKDYRVLNLDNPFNDAITSYYHKSIGGYHGAKLKRYQELIESRISEELAVIQDAFSSKSSDSSKMMTLKHIPVLNMLNTKYLIFSTREGEQVPLENRNALGNAWFVDNYKIVANADAEIAALKNFKPSMTAIIDKRFENMVSNYKSKKDSASSITMTSYQPNDLIYDSKTSKEQLAVFSEIYYEKGWNVYVDGVLKPYFRTNYVLRGMIIPAGTHKIEWKFEPKVYYTGEKISYAFNILLILVVIGGIFLELRGNKKETVEVAEKP